MAITVAQSYFLPHKRTSISDQRNNSAAFEERHQSLVKLQEKIDCIKKTINKANIFYLSNFKFIKCVVECLQEYLFLLEEEKHALTVEGYWSDWLNLQLPSAEIASLEIALLKKNLFSEEKQYSNLQKKAIEIKEIGKKIEFLNSFFEITKNDKPSSLSLFFKQEKENLIAQKQKKQEEIESAKLEVKKALNKPETASSLNFLPSIYSVLS